MPFISSVRGTYGLSRPKLEFVALGGSTTISGGYKIHTFTYTGALQTFQVLSGSKTIEIFMWGAGGAAGGTGASLFCFGGGGAYASSNVNAAPGNYNLYVGQGGQLGTQGCVIGVGGTGGQGISGQYAGGNGSAAGTIPCSGTGGGGGSASVFFNTSGSPIIIAGAGGGGGGTESVENGSGKGGGGGQNGTNGNGSGASGGIAGASSTTNGISATTLGGDHSGSGGGGGGVNGGGAGINPSNDALSGGGGGGGTSLGTTVVNGNGQTPGNTASPFYNSSYAFGGASGQNGGDGLIIIRYLI